MNFDSRPLSEKSKSSAITKFLPSGYGLKFFTIALLSLVLLFPASLIKGLVQERNFFKKEAERDVATIMGGHPKIQGLILTLPYKILPSENNRDPGEGRIQVLPTSLNIKGNLKSDHRHKGIYSIPVYSGDFEFAGEFSQPDWSSIDVSPDQVIWSKAIISLCINEVRGITESPKLLINGVPHIFSPPSIDMMGLSEAGNSMSAINRDDFFKNGLSVSATVKIHGSEGIYFTPVAGDSKIEISSDWDSPSFVGDFAATHTIKEGEGFNAVWSVSRFNTTFPLVRVSNSDLNSRINPDKSKFGVEFHESVDRYVLTERASKYALLFIVMTFSAFFLFEVVSKQRLHMIQYLFAGLAICLFYLLLLSISEHVAFQFAYICAALFTAICVTLYSSAIFKSTSRGILMGSFLGILYGYLWILLQAENFSLLFGSVGLFTILCTLMYLTRNVNWFQHSENPDLAKG